MTPKLQIKRKQLLIGANNFAKINAEEFFKSVDVNGDGAVEYDEWLDFWRIVKGVGHTDEEILEELQNLKDKEAWIGFNDMPKNFQ